MKAFSYVNPANERDAVRALSPEHEKSMPLGGGQDLLARMKDYVTQPDRIVNVKGALDATVTSMPGGGLKIGAAMSIVDLAAHPQVAKLYPAMVMAAGEVGTQIGKLELSAEPQPEATRWASGTKNFCASRRRQSVLLSVRQTSSTRSRQRAELHRPPPIAVPSVVNTARPSACLTEG